MAVIENDSFLSCDTLLLCCQKSYKYFKNKQVKEQKKKTLLSKAHILQDTLLKVAWKDLTKGEELLYTNLIRHKFCRNLM